MCSHRNHNPLEDVALSDVNAAASLTLLNNIINRIGGK